MDWDSYDTTEKAWLEEDQRLRDQARQIALVECSEVDAEGVYHALRNLRRSPSERLGRALRLGRFRADAR